MWMTKVLYLQPNHTLTSFHFLFVKVARLLVRILDANVHLRVHTFSFCLLKQYIRIIQHFNNKDGPQRNTQTFSLNATFYHPRFWHWTHHAGQGEECGLDLSHVPVLKQIIGLKDVIGLQTISENGFDKVAQVLKLEWKESEKWLWGWILPTKKLKP